MDILSITEEWLREEGYTYFSKPPRMIPYRSWIRIGPMEIQLWNADGNTMWVCFINGSVLDLDYYVSSEQDRRENISLCDPEAFQVLRKALESSMPCDNQSLRRNYVT